MTIINDTGVGLAKRMKAARILAGLDQAQIAERVGVARQTVSGWERGLSEPSATYFVRWAKATGQPLEWLADGVVRPEGFEPPAYWSVACECVDRHGRGDCDLGCSCGWCAPEAWDEAAFWAIVDAVESGLVTHDSGASA